MKTPKNTTKTTKTTKPKTRRRNKIRPPLSDTIVSSKDAAGAISVAASLGLLPWGGQFPEGRTRPMIPGWFFDSVQKTMEETGYGKLAFNTCPEGRPRRFFFYTTEDSKFGAWNRTTTEDNISVYYSVSFDTDSNGSPVVRFHHSDCQLPERGSGERRTEYLFWADDLKSAMRQIIFSCLFVERAGDKRNW